MGGAGDAGDAGDAGGGEKQGTIDLGLVVVDGEGQDGEERKMRILSSATDGARVVQPEVYDWNLRRFAYNGYGEASDLTVR